MITTKYGDEGFTQLNGLRMRKDSQVIRVLGILDEAMASLEVAALHSTDMYREYLFTQVKHIYEISAIIAGYDINLEKNFAAEIDFMDEMISSSEYNHKFTLRYRNLNSAYVNMARTIVRKAERFIIERFYEFESEIDPIPYSDDKNYVGLQNQSSTHGFYRQRPTDEQMLIMKYLNRLSDFLFMLAEKTK